MKVNKTKNKGKGGAEVAEVIETEGAEEEEEVAETTGNEAETAQDEAEEEEEGSETPAPAKAAPKAAAVSQRAPGVAVVSVAPSRKHNWVTFICTKSVTPAPRVGHFDITKELMIGGLVAGNSYSLPDTVATHLVDSKFGVKGGQAVQQ